VYDGYVGWSGRILCKKERKRNSRAQALRRIAGDDFVQVGRTEKTACKRYSASQWNAISQKDRHRNAERTGTNRGSRCDRVPGAAVRKSYACRRKYLTPIR